MNTDLIASKLASLGFTTRITQTGLLVSLNRPLHWLEVEMALMQAFEDIRFVVTRISKNSVHVSEI